MVLVPVVVPKLTKLGVKLHMEAGTGAAVKLLDAAYKDVVIVTDRKTLLADADRALAAQLPSMDVIDEAVRGLGTAAVA